jgi:hypothetical protein
MPLAGASACAECAIGGYKPEAQARRGSLPSLARRAFDPGQACKSSATGFERQFVLEMDPGFANPVSLSPRAVSDNEWSFFIMKTQRVAIALTVLNLGILSWSMLRGNSAVATEVAPVLRGRALEIVDDHDRVRAMIKIFPADPTVKMPDGSTGYPETVLLRLINSKGAPTVKIAATEDGSGVSFGGESNPTHIQVLARGNTTSLKLVNQDGRQLLLKPQ